MNGYIKVQVVGDGQTIDCWQFIQDGEVIGYRDEAGNAILVPVIREETILDSTLQPSIVG